MNKHTKQHKCEEENPNLGDLPKDVIELLALIGSAAKMFIDGAPIGAFSGSHGDFITMGAQRVTNTLTFRSGMK
jgi:hypothetical protein